MFNKISIIGCGLIGSSILRAVEEKKLASKLSVFDCLAKEKNCFTKIKHRYIYIIGFMNKLRNHSSLLCLYR